MLKYQNMLKLNNFLFILHLYFLFYTSLPCVIMEEKYEVCFDECCLTAS